MADGLPQTNKIVRESRELERARERERELEGRYGAM